MFRHFALAIGALVLAACTAATDPWPGRYEGTRVDDGRRCDGTMLPAETDDTADITLERGTRGLFFSGACLFTLDELNATTARLEAGSCETTTSGGTPLHVEIVNGEAMLDGNELTLRIALDITSPDPAYCLTTSSTFIGTRR